MDCLNRLLMLGVVVASLALVACGGGEAEEMDAEAAAVVEAEPVDPRAVAAANRLAQRLQAGVELVPTQRGTANIGYTQPRAQTQSGFIITTFRIRNTSENAIAGFTVDEFWFDPDGNTVTGDQVRFREPIMVDGVREIELRVPQVPAMDRSNYEFSHQHGEVVTTLLDEIEAPPEPEEEEDPA
jgi:hypothetical protein